MEVLYGEGWYIEGAKKVRGKIILGEYKLYLKGTQGELTETYIPLDKIKYLRKTFKGIELGVRVSPTISYWSVLMGDRNNLSELVREIVKRRNFKKKFLRQTWTEKEG